LVLTEEIFKSRYIYSCNRDVCEKTEDEKDGKRKKNFLANLRGFKTIPKSVEKSVHGISMLRLHLLF